MNWVVYALYEDGSYPLFVREFSRLDLAVDFFQWLCDEYSSRTFLLTTGLIVSYRHKEV